MFNPHNVSCVMCQGSHIMCHMSCVTCHLSHVRIFFLSFNIYIYIYIYIYDYSFILKKIGHSGGAGRWRVCYQRGLPHLVYFGKWLYFVLLNRKMRTIVLINSILISIDSSVEWRPILRGIRFKSSHKFELKETNYSEIIS